MRSRVERKQTTSSTKASKAKSRMVRDHPRDALLPPNRATRGSVKPCTTNCATVLAIKRMLLMLVRSLMSEVITPPKEA